MRRRWRIAAVAGGVAAVGMLALAFRVLNTAGVFTEVTPGYAGVCRPIHGVIGAEDIAIDRKAGLAFISATDRRAPRDHPAAQDGLYTLFVAHPELGVTRLSGTPRDFHPHGISLYRAPDGALTLMAVNHRRDGSASIDMFTITESTGADGMPSAALTETGSVQSSLLFSPNDVVAVGAKRFYATNDHGSHTDLGRALETWLLLPRAAVIYFDGQVPRVVAGALRYANGIAASADGTKIYVSETLGRAIRTYTRQPISGDLVLENTFSLPAGLDNIDVDARGDLWVAGHPKLFDFADYGKDPSKPSPSEVFEVTTENGIPDQSRAVFTDLGTEIGASSIGASAGGHLLIGSVFDPKILDCTPR